jgi:hypothetical protein
MKGRRSLVLLTFATASLLGMRADAQNDPRPMEAKAACAAGDVQKGVALLAQLYAETNDPTWVFNQGRCYQENGQRDNALQRFREYLRKGDALPTEYRKKAEEHVRQLSQEPEPPPTSASSDVPVTPPAVAPEPPPSAPPAAADVSTEAGRLAAPWYTRKLYIGSAALAAGGVLGLVGGMVYSFKSRSLQKDFDARPKDAPGTLPYETWKKEQDQASSYRTRQWLGYTTAALCFAGAGAVLFLAERERREEQPTGASLGFAPVMGPGLGGGLFTVAF